MKRRIDSVVSSMAIVLLFAAIWLITGCEQENLPVASEQELLLAPGNGNGNGDLQTEGDDEGDSNAGGKGKNKGRGNPHTSSNITGNPHTASNPTGDPHIDNDVSGVNDNPEKPGKRKGEDKDKGVKPADDDPSEDSITHEGIVASVDGNNIILEDGIVIYTCPKLHWFVDESNNGNNDLLEALIGQEITVVGEPVYGDDGLTLVAIYAYTIKYITDENIEDIIIIRGPGKPPWAGPKP